ncbi:unnamed protein product [Toxocara canis]|uniref:DUF4283 domain-containing protein n=1 Tax=Toxocara canis TaxID=6265 RepID=A0A183UNK9_TOXCA|nr:unnamed protein product [Toxocara canis]
MLAATKWFDILHGLKLGKCWRIRVRSRHSKCHAKVTDVRRPRTDQAHGASWGSCVNDAVDLFLVNWVIPVIFLWEVLMGRLVKVVKRRATTRMDGPSARQGDAELVSRSNKTNDLAPAVTLTYDQGLDAFRDRRFCEVWQVFDIYPDIGISVERAKCIDRTEQGTLDVTF